MGKYTNNLQNHVLEFHETFKHPVADKPTALQLERGVSRSIWTGEELVELIHSMSSNESEFADAFYNFVMGLFAAYHKSVKEEFPKTDEERIVSQIDAISDALYFLFGTSVEIGVDVEKVFEIVQASNMSKLFTDEQGNKYVEYREDGKVLKSPEFFAPEEKIAEEIKRQINQ